MEPLTVTPLFAGLLALLYFFLSFTVIRGRGRHKVSLGDGGIPQFQRIVRGHANFTETVPLALILMLMAEMTGNSAALLYGIGGLLLAGRLVHAWCFLFTSKNMAARVAGMALTFFAIGIGAGANLWTAVRWQTGA